MGKKDNKEDIEFGDPKDKDGGRDGRGDDGGEGEPCSKDVTKTL